MQPTRRNKIGDRIVRHPRVREVTPIVVRTPPRRHQTRLFSSPFMIPVSFAMLIIIGGGLLMLPISRASGQATSALVAFFTSCSAVTVTGLTLVDTGIYWSKFGQAVIFALMGIGGLGFMTGATFVLILIGQRITLPERMLMRETLLANRLGGLVKLTQYVVLTAFVIYLIGMALMYWRFQSHYQGTEALWQAAFHSVSAFNNAGFSIVQGASLSGYRTDHILLAIFAVLIILGGISYVVMVDVFRRLRFQRFSLDTKLVLLVSLILWVAGALVIFGSEYGNSETLGPLPVGGKLATGLFHSISARTAGFATIDLGKAGDFTNLFIVALMFVGGAAGSTAGGIKVNAFAVLMVAVISSIRGRMHAEAFGREIPHTQVHRALAVAVLSMLFISGVVLFFTLHEKDVPFIRLLFEAVSAFGTVGLSAGATTELSSTGTLFLIFTMYVGRLGPLALVLLWAPKERQETYRFMQERVRIG